MLFPFLLLIQFAFSTSFQLSGCTECLGSGVSREKIEKIEEAMDEFGIRYNSQRAIFLTLLKFETRNLTYFEELASYDDYESNLFKKRGALPIRGRREYSEFSSALNVDFVSNPMLARDISQSFRIAAYKFMVKGGGSSIPNFYCYSTVNDMELDRELAEICQHQEQTKSFFEELSQDNTYHLENLRSRSLSRVHRYLKLIGNDIDSCFGSIQRRDGQDGKEMSGESDGTSTFGSEDGILCNEDHPYWNEADQDCVCDENNPKWNVFFSNCHSSSHGL